MKNFLTMIPITLLLAACAASSEEKCSSYGFTPGTDDFAACNMYVSEQKAQARRAYFQNLGQQLGNAAASAYTVPPAPTTTFTPRPSQFSSYRIGNKTYYCQTIGNNVTCK